MTVSSLAILLTAVTLLLRYRYNRSSSSGDYIRPADPSAGYSTILTYADGDDGGSTLGKKRPFHSASDYDADDVSPYAAFSPVLHPPSRPVIPAEGNSPTAPAG